MYSIGIIVIILCLFSQHDAVFPCGKSIEDSLYSGESEAVANVNKNFDRLYTELNELNDLYIEHIKTHYNNCTPPGDDLKAVDIVRKVLDTNDLGSLKSIPSSCPSYKDSNGLYTVKVFALEPFKVLCNANIAGPGWTVVASRSGIGENFFRNWQEYKRGFGDLEGDFFIGLEKLHAITITQPHELFIYLEDFEGNKRFAKYDDFLIGTESDKYKMSKLGTYAGDMTDSLRDSWQLKFSTFDNDNDGYTGNYAATYMSGWWHSSSLGSNLFGLYLNGTYTGDINYKGMHWKSWRGLAYSYKVMKMMVKPKCSCSLGASMDIGK